jgi:hypothetical protein
MVSSLRLTRARHRGVGVDRRKADPAQLLCRLPDFAKTVQNSQLRRTAQHRRRRFFEQGQDLGELAFHFRQSIQVCRIGGHRAANAR